MRHCRLQTLPRACPPHHPHSRHGTPTLDFFAYASQVGFVSLEVGYGRSKNVKNILLKNTVNILLCAICWWAVGYAFSYGSSTDGFIG